MKKRRMLSGALALVMSLMVLASPALAAEAVSDGEMPAAVETEPAVPETEETTTPGEPPVESQEPPAEEPADPAPEQPEEPVPPEESVPETPSEVPAGPALRQDHVRYMEGFPQGTFQPEKQLTRAQAAQLVYRLLAQPESGTGDCSYTDVPSSQWYAQPVRALCALGLFDNGTTFRPEAVITRAEFVDLLVRLKPQAEGTAVFPGYPLGSQADRGSRRPRVDRRLPRWNLPPGKRVDPGRGLHGGQPDAGPDGRRGPGQQAADPGAVLGHDRCPLGGCGCGRGIGVPHPGSGQRRRELERCGPDKDDLSDRVPSGGRSAVLRGP